MNRNIARTTKQYFTMIFTALLFVVLLGMVASNSVDFNHTHKVVIPEVPATYEEVPNPPLMTLGIWIGWIALVTLVCAVTYWTLLHATE